MGVAPGWGLRRLRARAAAYAFEAASGGRRTEGWRRSSADANAANATALPALRELSRDLVRNNGWARRGVQAIANNTVGWGIQPRAVGVDEGPAESAIETWNDWSTSPFCDFDGRMPFSGLQRLVMDTVVLSGEALVVRQPAGEDDAIPVPLRIQVLEPDYLDTNKFGDGPGTTIVQGIELDSAGRRVAYWLYTGHPGAMAATSGRTAFSLESRRVPAGNVLHIYRVERPGQARGVPWLASAIARLNDFDEFEDAQLMQQRVAACFSAFVQDLDGAGSGTVIGAETSPADDTLESLEPGHVSYLRPGQTVSFATPPPVTDGSFTTRNLRRVAASLGVTYEDLTGDYCVAPETRVLRADLRWVRAEFLVEGDELVAFDEEPPGGQGHRRKWRKASVVRTGKRDLPRRRITTNRGTVTVSDAHMFLCTDRGPIGARRGEGLQSRSESPATPGAGQRWVRADKLRAGDKIVFLAEPWSEGKSYLHGYLKGMADGEGYVDKADAKIGIAQNPGPVFNELGGALAELGFRATHRAANGGHKVQQWSIQGIGDCLRFLGEVRPTRLLRYAETLYVGRALSGGAKKGGPPTWVTVDSVEDVGVGPVITLATSTKTLITEGLCSHNTQVNFSSARMGRLAHWANIHDWRWNMLIPQLCDGVWRWVMELAAEMEGWEEVPVADWSPPPMPMLEPDKEGLAYQRLVRAGAMTLKQMIRELGYDPAAHLAEIAETNDELDALGIVLDSDPRQTNASGGKQGAGGQTGEKPAEEEPAEEPAESEPMPMDPEARVAALALSRAQTAVAAANAELARAQARAADAMAISTIVNDMGAEVDEQTIRDRFGVLKPNGHGTLRGTKPLAAQALAAARRGR